MAKSGVQTIGIIMNGVTGRMGASQHLVRSILAIRKQGGVRTKSGEIIMPDPILVGRNAAKLKGLAEDHGLTRFSTDLDACLADPRNQIYFDSQATSLRAKAVLKAIHAKKAVYSEKPLASTLQESMTLTKSAIEAGVKNGVVQDKLWLPGLLKLKELIDSNFFGTILSVRGEFGYWVFDGRLQPGQRPSWNYRKEDGGGIISDMFCHWRYLVDNLFGDVAAVSCLGATHIPTRLDEEGKEYRCTADDAAYATLRCGNGIICQFNSSWAVRVRRDDLLTLQVDGTEGSAIAGLQRCYAQRASTTPRFVWNPDVENPHSFLGDWEEFSPDRRYENAFKAEWELFLKHVVSNEAFPWTFLEGAKGIQFSELALKSWKERCWLDVPELRL
jgi:predicted dehydrogenase